MLHATDIGPAAFDGISGANLTQNQISSLALWSYWLLQTLPSLTEGIKSNASSSVQSIDPKFLLRPEYAELRLPAAHRLIRSAPSPTTSTARRRGLMRWWR